MSTAEHSPAPESAIEHADRLLGAETVDRLAQFDGGGLPVLSLYLSVPAAPRAHVEAKAKTDSLLHEIRPLGEDHSIERAARLSVRADIERVSTGVDNARIHPGGLAFFSCSGAKLFEVVRLPRPVRDRVVVDETPWLRPMLAAIGDRERCCAVVVDSSSADAWELYLGQVRETALAKSVREPGSRGTRKHRDDPRAEEQEKRHFKQVAEALEQLQRVTRYDVLALGGHESELPRFQEYLGGNLRERVVGTFTVDHDTLTPATVREQAQAILDRHELERQRRSVAEVLGVAAAGGPAAVGVRDCLWAGSVAAVADLYLQEGATEPGVVCDESKWFALSGETCPLCGRRTRGTADVLDELAEAVIGESGAVHPVRAETELQERIAAASLRFELPPNPESAAGSAS